MSCPTSASNIPMEDLRCSFCQQANCDVRIASCGCFLHTVRGSEFPSCCKTRKRRNIQSNKQASDNTESTASLRIANPAYRYTLASVAIAWAAPLTTSGHHVAHQFFILLCRRLSGRDVDACLFCVPYVKFL